MKKIISHRCENLSGSVQIPGDKSISHRALMFASIAQGESILENLLEGHDCIATLQVMRTLGVHIELLDGRWIIRGHGRASLKEPNSILDCKNSGTTIRLMSGLLAAMPFMAILDGSDQLKTRPMGRVLEPLRSMGANIFGRSNNLFAPVVSMAGELKGFNHDLQVQSAQVKSALILAALFAKGPSTINNVGPTRDHSERLLTYMGADIKRHGDSLSIQPLKNELAGLKFRIPGDMSSAAFLIVAGVLLARKPITLENIGLNQTRTGIVDALKKMGAHITFTNEKIIANEEVGDVHISQSDLSGAEFSGDIIVRMIDEIPILALAATQAYGKTIIKDASELKVKESNRIAKTVECLRALGANIQETNDGMSIIGPTKLHGAELSSSHDHRLALLLIIAGLISKDKIIINNAEVIDDSFPGFLSTLATLGAHAIEV